MEQQLALRQSQRVIMTPALQQAIELLQLSTADLQQVVQNELLENPLLEESTDSGDSPDGGISAASPDLPSEVSLEATGPREPPSHDLPFDVTAVGDDGPSDRSLVAEEEREQPFEGALHTVDSLSDHLDEQLRLSTDDSLVRRVGRAIIGNLDDDGYLRADLEDIARGCAARPADVQRVLALVQGFDPPGVAARSVQECLLLQLRAAPAPDALAIAIVEHHFPELGRRRYGDLARVLKVTPEQVMQSIESIHRLEPKPGRRFDSQDPRYVVPDVIIHKVGTDYVVALNEEGVPRLRINAFYRSLLRQSGDEARHYVEQKVRSALWLIKSVEQRQRTLRKVADSIFRFQRDFLDKGVAHLRPLALHDVSEDIGMHESTVSRVTANKYVDTPRGLYELRFFFQNGLAADGGGKVSSISVKTMIQECVTAEDPVKPLSDLEIASHLRGRGLHIARRTVAKYRVELGIPPSQHRHQPLMTDHSRWPAIA
jgi:RNA polymerase sigma-54 factor